MPQRDPKPWDEMTPFEKAELAARLRMEMKTAPPAHLDQGAVMSIATYLEEPEFQARPGTLGPGERCPRGCPARFQAALPKAV